MLMSFSRLHTYIHIAFRFYFYFLHYIFIYIRVSLELFVCPIVVRQDIHDNDVIIKHLYYVINILQSLMSLISKLIINNFKLPTLIIFYVYIYIYIYIYNMYIYIYIYIYYTRVLYIIYLKYT